MVREGYTYAHTRYGEAELGFHQAEADAQGSPGRWGHSTKGGDGPWDYRQENSPDPDMSLASRAVILLQVLLILNFTMTECIWINNSQDGQLNTSDSRGPG